MIDTRKPSNPVLEEPDSRIDHPLIEEAFARGFHTALDLMACNVDDAMREPVPVHVDRAAEMIKRMRRLLKRPEGLTKEAAS